MPTRDRDIPPQPAQSSASFPLQARVTPQLPQPITADIVPAPQAAAKPVIPPHLQRPHPTHTGPTSSPPPAPIPPSKRMEQAEVSVPSKQSQIVAQGDGTELGAISDFRRTVEQWHAKIVEFVTRIAVPNAPPWLVSLSIHLAVIIALALIALPKVVDSAFVLEVSHADEVGEPLLDDTHFLDAIELLEVDPALSFDHREVEDSFASSVAPAKIHLFDAAPKLESAAIGLALKGREKGAKNALLAAYGGTRETENAVELALDWLKRYQRRDGTWSLAGPYADGVAGTENPLAATAMALLAFQGAGSTHQSGQYQANVKRAMDALLRMQDRDGSFFSTQRIQSSHQLYSQAQASIAICELYGMTQDPLLREPAQRALDYAASIQADDGNGGGGWRYQPGTKVDTSVTGWFVIAIKSGEMGQLSVPSSVKDRITRYLDNVAAVPDESDDFIFGSRYRYQISDKQQRVSMTAEALLCRQYLGWERDDPRLLAGVRYVGEHPIDWDEANVYYWYYATQVMHHMGGDAWDKWNRVMRKALPGAQVKTGRERGSWNLANDKYGYTGGRLFMTCLCTYMLEVYYRHMPIYQH